MVKEPNKLPDISRVEPSDDPIEYAIRCVLAYSPDFNEALKVQIQKRITDSVREVYGGEMVYVGRPDHSVRNAQIRRDYRSGEHIPLLVRRYGLSKARLWQIINE